MTERAKKDSFETLSPEVILDAIESQSGLLTDGRLLALNSYENRVYRIGIEAVSYTHLTLPTIYSV